MEIFASVGVLVFLAGVIYALGRYSVRVENLEKWRDEVKAEFKEFHGHLLRFEKVLLETKDKD